MEIGNFLGNLKGSQKNEPKKFLALILTDEVVQAAVWHVSGTLTEVVALGTPVEWDGDTGTTSELVTAVDATISSAIEGLGDEPDKVILGIPNTWIDKNGVLGVKKEFISKIRKELELEAIGYVVIAESVLSYLKIQEGTPSTSILIQVSRDELTIILVRLGRIEAIENIGRSDDVVEDVTEGIARFKVADNLPSRIILFNSMHSLDDIIQNLLSVDWPAQFNFIHTPKIESLPKDIAIRALVVAGGSEVAKSLGIPVSQAMPSHSVVTDVVEETDTIEQDEQAEEVEIVESTLGTEVDPLALLSAEEIGFSGTQKHQKVDFIDPDDDIQNSEIELPVVEIPQKSRRTPLVMPKISLPKLKFNLSRSKPIWWILGGGIVLLGLLAFYLAWILPTATIQVNVLPKDIDEKIDITLSSVESSINFAGRIVPASIESVSESGEKGMETTGKKTVGEGAKGGVTIYNKTTSPKTFSKGTTLAFGNLKFSLDNDVSVASSSSTTEGITFGKNTVAITASGIGSDSNLPASTEFTIASFGKDSYIAKNDSALSGGTSQEVQVVGKDDQKTLVKDLTEELLTTLKVSSESSSAPGIGVYLIPDSAKLDTVTYSAKVGEEAKNLTANMTLSASLLKYKIEDVETLVNSSIDGKVPQGYVRSELPSSVELSATSVDSSAESVKGSANVKVALLPVIDQVGLKSSIKGKKVGALENILRSAVPGYVNTEVTILPRWYPTRFKIIPRNPDNIKVLIKPAI